MINPFFFINRTVESHLDHGDEDQVDRLEQQAEHGTVLVCQDDGWFRSESPSVVVERSNSKRTQTLATPGQVPAGVVWHWTATNRGTMAGCVRRIQEPARVLKDGTKERESSFHFGLPATGPLYQAASVRRGTWHAGGPTAKRFILTRTGPQLAPSGVSANALMIGVELECVGEVRLIAAAGKPAAWMGWPFGKDGVTGPIVPENQVAREGSRHFHKMTDHEISLATYLVIALVERDGNLDRRALSWTHAMIDPGRKTDPGPIWTNYELPAILDAAGM